MKKDLNKQEPFVPPSIKLFRKEKGFGYARLARLMLPFYVDAVQMMGQWLQDNGLLGAEPAPGRTATTPPHDHAMSVLRVYGMRMEVNTYLTSIEAMTTEVRAQFLELDKGTDYDAVRAKFIQVEAVRLALEDKCRDVIVARINEEIAWRLAEWEEALTWAEESPASRPEPYNDDEEMSGERMVDTDEFCQERSDMQWAMLGLFSANMLSVADTLAGKQPPLDGILAFDFWQCLEEMDKRFRPLIKDKPRGRGRQFWLDTNSFWWEDKGAMKETDRDDK